MKLKPEYSVRYDEDDICIVRLTPAGGEEYVTTLTASAAMAVDAFQRGMTREAVIEAVMTEFNVPDRDRIAADLDVLVRQMIALGFAEE